MMLYIQTSKIGPEKSGRKSIVQFRVKIRKSFILCGIWINESADNDTRSEILLKLISIKYNNKPKNWDMNHINQVEKAYSKVSKIEIIS